MCSTSARRLARAGRRHTGGEHATHCSAAPQAPIDQAVAGSGMMRRVMWTLCIRTRTHSFHEARIRTSPLSAAPLLRESPLFHQLLHPFAQRCRALRRRLRHFPRQKTWGRGRRSRSPNATIRRLSCWCRLTLAAVDLVARRWERRWRRLAPRAGTQRGRPRRSVCRNLFACQRN